MDYSHVYKIINVAKCVGSHHFEEGANFGPFYIEYMADEDAFFVINLEEKCTLLTTEHNLPESVFVERSKALEMEHRKTGAKFVFERGISPVTGVVYTGKKH